MDLKNINATFTLCCEQLEQVKVVVIATIAKGKLTISGQDIGPLCLETFGDSDYEYWYSFDTPNTEKLFKCIIKLNSEDYVNNPTKGLVDLFSGLDGCNMLCRFCSLNNIQYTFSSYV